MLKKCGISITPEFTQVDGRVLHPPKVGQKLATATVFPEYLFLEVNTFHI
jgi:hypothetical protein